MAAHAQLSPSSAARWMVCPGSVALCADMPESTSKYADEGTAAHELAERCLRSGNTAAIYLGNKMENGVEVDADMVSYVQQYVNYVLDLTGGVHEKLVEQRLPLDVLTGEVDAFGTADAIVFCGDELCVVDLKYGMGEAVEADHNPQLQIYALAALREFDFISDFKRVRMVIHQPRLHKVSEWVQTVEELEAFALEVMGAAAATTLPQAPLVPSTKGCRWCKAKATCPKLHADSEDIFQNVDPDDVATDDLALAMSKVDLIEGWCKAVRAEVEKRLLDGRAVPGFKLVQGRKGSRAWTDAAAAEALLKAMRVPHDKMYDYKVISPTSADKLAKDGSIGPRQWPKVVELITQADGKPSVAPVSDKRPALVIDDFTHVSTTDLN